MQKNTVSICDLRKQDSFLFYNKKGDIEFIKEEAEFKDEENLLELYSKSNNQERSPR